MRAKGSQPADQRWQGQKDPLIIEEPSQAIARNVAYGVAIGVLLACAWAYITGEYLELPYPRGTFLMGPWGRFGDLTDFFPLVSSNAVFRSPLAVYPPFSYLLVKPLAVLGTLNASLVLLVICGGGLAFFAYTQLGFLDRSERIAVSVLITLFTYPFLFAFDRGNLELVVALMLALFVLALQSKRPNVAACCLGFAIALKGFPLVFVIVLLRDRKWRSAAVAVSSAALLTLISLRAFHISIGASWSQLLANLSGFSKAYAIGDAGFAFNTSAFGLLKFFIVDVCGMAPPSVEVVYTIYLAAGSLCGLVILAMAIILPLKFWERITILTVLVLLLPPVSSDYRLSLLIIPLVLFLSKGTTSRNRVTVSYAITFTLLMIPKAYLLLRPENAPTSLDGAATLGVLVNPLLLLILLALIVVCSSRRRALLRVRPAVHRSSGFTNAT